MCNKNIPNTKDSNEGRFQGNIDSFLWPFKKIRIIIVMKSGLQTTDMSFSLKEHENPSKYFQQIS